jgi:hypothetical protein
VDVALNTFAFALICLSLLLTYHIIIMYPLTQFVHLNEGRTMAQRMADAFNRFVDLNIVPKVQPIVEKDLVPDSVIRLGMLYRRRFFHPKAYSAIRPI